jgi:OmcA/MtrC family decaheme c-type cytochrome
MHTFNRSAALALAAMVAVAGCSGEDGKNGVNGQDLVNTLRPETCSGCHSDSGGTHQAIYNMYTDASNLAATVVSVASVAKGTTPETYDVTVTFSLTKNGAAYDVGTAGIKAFAQKTVYVSKYDPATGLFGPSTSLSVLASLGGGQYTAKNDAAATTPVVAAFAPESSNAVVYGYFAEGPTLIPVKGNYKLYDNVASMADSFGTVDYASTANVSACEGCHGAPYQKHGYRAAVVAGLPDFVACKTCHYDNRSGHDTGWQLLADDPLAFANQAGVTTAAQDTLYAYKATVMNDTHMSHAMEFAYPQSMANCSTCHAGKLGSILVQANFNVTTCKSCHPVTGPAAAYVDAKRAPALVTIMPLAAHADFGADAAAIAASLYAGTGPACTDCHADTSATRKFAAIHTGYNKQIYKADGTKYAASVTTSIGTIAYNATTKVLTVPFTVSGAAAGALIKPTVVISLYGYDTKDFLVSGHSSQSDGTNNLEWTEGATQRSDPTKSANSNRLTVTPLATAGNTAWTATADLTLWAAKIADGSVKAVEIVVLPVVGVDQTAAVSSTNPAISIAGTTQSFDLVAKAATVAYGKAIVAADKCNACHDRLGTTFHSPSYGSAGVVGCRVCHTINNGGSHLEMQSRSIDSYVHAIHGMQPFDIGDINFADPVEKLRYEHHIESTYPNFTLLNCESCHNPGTFEVPRQSRSLPGILSASDAVTGRAITGIPAYTTGPVSRACGSCHRTTKINEDNAAGLAMINKHVEDNGYLLDGTSTVLADVITTIMAFFQ